MKILQIGSLGLSSGGVGGYIKTLVGDNENYVIATNNGDHVNFEYYDPRYKIVQIFSKIYEVKKIIDKNNISLIHAHTQRTGLIILMTNLITSVPYVYTPHGMRHTQKNSIHKYLHLMIEFLIIKYSKATIVLTKNEKDEFPIFSQKITKIRSVISVPDFFKRKKCISEKLRNSNPKPLILMVGSVDQRKNYELFIKVAEHLQSFKFKWIGDGPDLEKVRQQLSTLSEPNVEFWGRGNKDDVFQALVDADLFWMTSKQEGLPLVFLEAMSAGTPIITNKFFGFEETIVSGETGLAHELNSVDDAISKLSYMIKNPELLNSIIKNTEEIAYLHQNKEKFRSEYQKVFSMALD